MSAAPDVTINMSTSQEKHLMRQRYASSQSLHDDDHEGIEESGEFRIVGGPRPEPAQELTIGFDDWFDPNDSAPPLGFELELDRDGPISNRDEWFQKAANANDAKAPGPPKAPAPAISSTVDEHAAVVRFAGFGSAPDSFLACASYTIRVMVRRQSLRRGLAAARWRAQDVSLYERALACVDLSAYNRGLAALVSLVVGACTALVVAGLLLEAFK